MYIITRAPQVRQKELWYLCEKLPIATTSSNSSCCLSRILLYFHHPDHRDHLDHLVNLNHKDNYTTLAKWATTPADEKIYPEESLELALFTLSWVSAASTMEAWKMFNCSCSPNPQSLPTGQLAEGAAKNLLPTRVGEGDAITDHERQNQEKWK